MNKKGQALVEFILILPVLLLILMAMIDIGNIFLTKYELENNLETVTEMYKNNDENNLNTFLTKENLTLNKEKTNAMTTLTLKQTVQINAPLLNNILGKNYEISSSKTFFEKDS